MENITLKIDQETQDLVLDDSGSLELIPISLEVKA